MEFGKSADDFPHEGSTIKRVMGVFSGEASFARGPLRGQYE